MPVALTPVRVLLTVPHMNRTASPYREMMALARYLPDSVYRLTVCTLRDTGFEETAPILASMNVPSLVAPFRPTGHNVRQFVRSIRLQNAIDRLGPFEIQHSMDFTSSPFEAIMALTRSRAYVYSQRNLNENGHRLFLKIKIRCARRIISISDAVTRFLLTETDQSRIREVTLGIDLENHYIAPMPNVCEPRILMVGQFERRKRHQDAIRAIAVLQSEFPRLRLMLVGNTFDEPYVAELHALAAETGLHDRVEFLGPRTDVMDLMRHASALILCSDREAFGWVLIEAMSVGLPVIASDVDGPRQIIEHNKTGLLVPVGDIQGYAAGIRRLLTSPELCSSLAASARIAVERNYSAHTMVQKIRQVYREVIPQESGCRN